MRGDFRIGQWLIQPQLNSISDSTKTVRVEPRIMEVLVYLAEHTDEVPSKDRILQAVWADTFVSENTLTNAISALRKAFEDDPHEPKVIETIPGRGYRLIPSVTRMSSSPEEPTGSAPLRRRPWIFQVSGLLLAGTAAAGLWWLWPEASRSPKSLQIIPLTSDGGGKNHPSLSPDGKKVAYMWAGPSGDNWDIYVKPLNPGAATLRLTDHPAEECQPVWSPDGESVAFRRIENNRATIYTVPWMGGKERRIVEIPGPVSHVTYDVSGMSWSPDGRYLAFGERPVEGESARIVLLSLETREKRALTTPPPRALGDMLPSFSPDGREVAFFRSPAGWGEWDLWVQAVEEGEARKITSEEFVYRDSLSWIGPGQLLFSASYDSILRLRTFRLRVEEGVPEPVTGLGESNPVASVRGSLLVGLHLVSRDGFDIWRIPGPRNPQPDRPPREIVHSTFPDYRPVYSPDGRRIAFESMRSGSLQIWLCNSDGSDPVQLTDDGGIEPRWSPDGTKVLFEKESGLGLVDVQGGGLRPLPGFDDAKQGVFSPDGKWIYFTDILAGNLWKASSSGGPRVQITRNGGIRPQVSGDGKFLYYVKAFFSNDIWRVSVDGGEEENVVSTAVVYDDWAVGPTGLYYPGASVPLTDYRTYANLRGRRRLYRIHYLDFETGETRLIFEKEGQTYHRSLAVSPDEHWVLFGEMEPWESDLLLVENFR